MNLAPAADRPPRLVEFESPLALAGPQALQGYLRLPDRPRSLARGRPAARLRRRLAGDRRALGQAARGVGLRHADHRPVRHAWHHERLHRRTAATDPVRCLSRAEFPCRAVIGRPGSRGGGGIFARRPAGAALGRAQPDRTQRQGKIPRGDRLLSALPRSQGQHDGADADPDRRARRLDAGRRVPQPRRRPRRLGYLAREGQGVSDRDHRLSRRLSRFRRAALPHARRSSSAITSNSTRRRGIDRSTRCRKFLYATIGGKEKQP